MCIFFCYFFCAVILYYCVSIISPFAYAQRIANSLFISACGSVGCCRAYFIAVAIGFAMALCRSVISGRVSLGYFCW